MFGRLKFRPKPKLGAIREKPSHEIVKEEPKPTDAIIEIPQTEQLKEEAPIETQPDEIVIEKPYLLEENISGKSIVSTDVASQSETEIKREEIPKRKCRIRSRKYEVDESDDNFKIPEKPKGKFKPKVSQVSRGTKFTSLTYGKLSQEAKYQMVQKFGPKPPNHSSLRMLDLIYFNPIKNPMTPKAKKMELNEDFEIIEEKSEAPRQLVPRLNISADGEVFIEKESVILEKPNIDNRQLIQEDGLATKKRKKKEYANRAKWSFEDTVKFYRALNMIGSDFEMIKTFFPDRSRKCIKAKFKREEKLRGPLIDKILGSHSVKYDIEKLREELEVEEDFKTIMAGKREKMKSKIDFGVNTWRRKGLQGEKGVDEILKKNRFYIDEDDETQDEDEPEEVDNNYKNQSDEDSDISDTMSVYSTDSECSTAKKRRVVKRNDYAKMLEDVLKENIINDKLVFNTNIEVGDLKYTQSVIYNPENLENPIDVNETIAHQEPDQSQIQMETDCETDFPDIINSGLENEIKDPLAITD